MKKMKCIICKRKHAFYIVKVKLLTTIAPKHSKLRWNTISAPQKSIVVMNL